MTAFMEAFYKSVLDADKAPIVLCSLEHTIVYMNKAAAKRYAKEGGFALVGSSLLDCHPPRANGLIEKILAWFGESPEHNVIHTFVNEEENKHVYMIALRDETGSLIGYYEKHAYRNRDSMPLYDFSKQKH